MKIIKSNGAIETNIDTQTEIYKDYINLKWTIVTMPSDMLNKTLININTLYHFDVLCENNDRGKLTLVHKDNLIQRVELENKLEFIKDILNDKINNYNNKVKYWEKERRNLEDHDTFYKKSYQRRIHEYNARINEIKEILNTLDKE